MYSLANLRNRTFFLSGGSIPRLILVVTDDDPAKIEHIHQKLKKVLPTSDELRYEFKVEKVSSNPLSIEGVIIHTPQLCAKGEWRKQPYKRVVLPKGVKKLPLSDLPLSARVANGLLREGVSTLERLSAITVIDLLDTRGLGHGSVVEIARLLAQYGVEMQYGNLRFEQDYWHCLKH